MKIRGDFVTNSSFASYILTMSEEVFNEKNDWYYGEIGMGPFLKYVKDKIKNEGSKISIDGEEIYSLKLSFHTDDAIPIEGIEYETNVEEIDYVMYTYDVKDLNDKELTSFLYYIIVCRPNFLSDIGLTKVHYH